MRNQHWWSTVWGVTSFTFEIRNKYAVWDAGVKLSNRWNISSLYTSKDFIKLGGKKEIIEIRLKEWIRIPTGLDIENLESDGCSSET